MRKHGEAVPTKRLALHRDTEKDARRAKKYPMVGSISELLRNG
jgi:hypothetical protein